MDNEKLTVIGLTKSQWAEDAIGVVNENWDFARIVEEEAVRIQQQVLRGLLTIDDLRACVCWANALDKEAVEAYGADLTKGDQQAERTARRMMHLAGRTALEGLKSSRKRLIAHVACKQAQNLVQ